MPRKYTTGYTAADYLAAVQAHNGNATAAARELGVDPSTIQKAVKKLESTDSAVRQGMARHGLENVPGGTWVKTHDKDEHGRTYSFYVPKQKDDEETAETIRQALHDTFSGIPTAKLPKPPGVPDEDLLGFIPLNDLHGGLYAWAEETGAGDWDLDLATSRLEKWVGSLVTRMPVCDECILFYNGDTLHANGNEPFTPASKHILDTDSRQFKVVGAVAASIIATVDLALQKHNRVRLVIKRGNHDEDAYLALLMAAKYRYANEDRAIVEEDPSAYWAFEWGKVALFGHHGDRQKPMNLVMKMAADQAEMWGRTKYRYLWTGHLHQRASDTFYGCQWERASCITEPDAYGAAWGAHAEAQAVIYHREKGEHERFSVRP